MSDELNQTEEQVSQAQAGTDEGFNDLPAADELSLLKQRARMMGIGFSNNIGLQALRQKIEAKQNEVEDEVEDLVANQTNPLTGDEPNKPKMTIRQLMVQEELKLIRLRITNLDPKKKDLPGEIFTVANEYLGTVRKFVPFGEVTDNGYHVPNCIYQMMKERKFLNIRTRKSSTGKIYVEKTMAQEFALEVLPPLSKTELERLANAQAAAGTFTNPDY